MAKRKTAAGVARVSTAPTPAGVPAEAPLRPALTAGTEEAETATARATNPHAVGADRTSRIKEHLAAVRAKEAARKTAPTKPVAKRKKRAAVKPTATTEL
jgi:hypothetical protein